MTSADLLEAAALARAVDLSIGDTRFASRLRFARGMSLLTLDAQVIDLSAPGALASAPTRRRRFELPARSASSDRCRSEARGDWPRLSGMTDPSPTTPTLEQRAATITEYCPTGWRVEPYGPSLAVFCEELPGAPVSVMSAENEAILAVAWRWHADRLEQNLNSALRALEAAPVDRAMLTEALQSAQLGVVWRPDRAIAAQPGATYQGEGGWSMTSAQVGHALWLCGYHPGDDPVEVFKRAGKRSIEWMEIEALLGKDLAKAREEDPDCTVESMVESLRDDAHAFADKIAAQETIILRLEAKAASRQDLRVYEMEECGVPRLAEQAMALFESLPEPLEARSYDVARAARIAVRIVCDPSKPRVQDAEHSQRIVAGAPAARVDFEPGNPTAQATVLKVDDGRPEDLIERLAWYGQRENRHTPYDPQDLLLRVVLLLVDRVKVLEAAQKPAVVTNTATIDLRRADLEKTAAALSTPIEPRIANKPAEKRERNIIDEVHGPGFADEYLGEKTRRYMSTNATGADVGLTIDGSIDAEFTDEPSQAPVRAAGWTGITWMSGKGRAKSLTLAGLRSRSDLGPNALRSDEMESLPRKAIKVLQRRDRLYAFHLPGGVKRYGYIDTWGHLRAGEPLAISIRPPEVKSQPPKPAQGIAWRRGRASRPSARPNRETRRRTGAGHRGRGRRGHACQPRPARRLYLSRAFCAASYRRAARLVCPFSRASLALASRRAASLYAWTVRSCRVRMVDPWVTARTAGSRIASLLGGPVPALHDQRRSAGDPRRGARSTRGAR